MNIVYHFRVRGTGAEAVHIAGIAGGFAQLGHDVSFVSPSGVDPLKALDPARNASAMSSGNGIGGALGGAPVRALHVLADRLPQVAFEGMELAYNAYGLTRLRARLAATQAKLLYERYAFFNAAGALAHLHSGVPLVVEVNELAGHERVRDQRLVAVCRKIERFVLCNATLVVTVSDFLSEHARNITDGRVPVITVPNGVPARWRDAAPSQTEVERLRQELCLDEKLVILFTGKLVHWHNFPTLLASVARVRQKVPRATLLIVGDGPMQNEIRQIAADLNMEDGIRLVGAVPHEAVRTYIELADVAVVPYTNDYRSPIKLFEYMAHGKPVVAPAMPPIEIALQHGKTGMLFARDGSGMDDAILHLLCQPELAWRLGDAALARVFRDFTWEKHAERILEAVAGSAAQMRSSPELVSMSGTRERAA